MLLTTLLRNSNLEYSVYDRRQGSVGFPLASLDVEEIFLDSRRVVTRGLYIAIDGLHTDSHAFVADAASHGALAAVVSEAALLDGRIDTRNISIPLVAVKNCREAMARLYAAWYGDPQEKMTFIGVTGTNGKTTVTRMIYEILASAGERCGLIGTAGNMISTEGGEELQIRSKNPLANMTTPDPEELYRILDRMQGAGVRYVIMEVTSHSLSLCKVAPINFEIAVFTNLTEDHLDFHRNMEEYYRAKRTLFDKAGYAVINIDDRYGRRLCEEIGTRRATVSAEGRSSDYAACDVRSHGECGMEYRLASGRMRLRIKTKIPGAITVMNTLEAAAVANILGIPPREIKDAIFALPTIRGRLERLKLPTHVGFSVYIDYAHTPDALENLLRTARMMQKKGQRIVLLFGCGGERERQKRAMMGRIASGLADFFVITSDNPRSEEPSDIISDIISGTTDEGQFTVIEDRERAIEYVVRNARAGDIILLAGKGHEEYSIDKNGKQAFFERELVDKFIKRYYG